MVSGTVPSPWIYFLAGALLPSLVLIIMQPTLAQQILNNFRDVDDEHNDTDDDDDDDDDESEDDEYVKPKSSSSSKAKEWGMKDGPYKMLFLVNVELGMGKGKIAAQCSHAAVGCYKRAMRVCPNAVQAWERTGCAKIAVKCPTQDEMERIAFAAMDRDIPIYLVEDAGRTQIAAGSRTVLGLGPAPTYTFENLTNHLKLM